MVAKAGRKMRTAKPARTRITIRASKGVRTRLQEAADLTGATVNQFLVQAGLKEAERVIENERLIVPSTRDMKMILDLLDNPPPPNARLRAALKRHRELFGDAEDSPAD